MKLFSPAVFLFALLAAAPPAGAATETPWAPSPHAETRLIAGLEGVPEAAGAAIVMGWQVRLDPGWKTYWRTPGEAGKPPRFSWEGSLNVASVRLLYPFPERFEIFGLHTYGYAGEVIYPLVVEPLVAGAPLTLRARVEFLVCETLCVPAEQSYELSLPGAAAPAPSRHFAHLAGALAKVPRAGGLNAELDVVEAKVFGGEEAINLWLRVRGENLMSGAEIVLEDGAGLRFGVPARAVGADPREAVFVAAVKEANRGGEGPQAVTLLVSDGWGNALEKRLDIDFNSVSREKKP